jgi:Holliday junction resolvase RusA-like endonuclease
MGKVPSMPLNKARVQATRCSSREIDTDNLYGSFKSVIDSLKFHGVVIDDKPSCVFLNCQWEKVKNKDAGIRLTVEEIENV